MVTAQNQLAASEEVPGCTADPDPGGRHTGGRQWHAVSIVSVAAIVILVVAAIREPAVTRHRGHDLPPVDVAAPTAAPTAAGPSLGSGEATIISANGSAVSLEQTEPTRSAAAPSATPPAAAAAADVPALNRTEAAATTRGGRRRVVELGNMTLRFPALRWVGAARNGSGACAATSQAHARSSAPPQPRRSRKHKPFDMVVPDLCVRPVGSMTHRSATNHGGVRLHLATEVMSEKLVIPYENVAINGACGRASSVAVQLTVFGECNVYHALYRVLHFAAMIVRMSRDHIVHQAAASTNASSSSSSPLFTTVVLMDKQRDQPYDVHGCSAMRRLLVEILQALVEEGLPDPRTRPWEYLASIGYGKSDGNASAMANALGVDAIASSSQAHGSPPPAVGALPTCFDYGVVGMDSASFKSQRPPLVRDTMAPALKRVLRQRSSKAEETTLRGSERRAADIILVARITRRRFLNEASVIAEFDKAVASASTVLAGIGGAAASILPLRARVLHFENLTLDEQVIACTGAMALVGLQGAALTWGYAMTDGASIMEVNVPMHSDAAAAGLNANPLSTFGHVATLARINHIALRIPGRFAVKAKGQHGWGAADIEVPAAPFGTAVQCAVLAGALPAKHAAVGAACDASKWPALS